MEVRTLLSDFTGGEVSPRVDARADLEKYKSAARKIRNAVVSMQGGVLKRRGTQRMGTALASGATPVPETLYIPWRSGAADDLILEITGTTVRGWKNGGLILSGGIPYSIQLPVAVTARTQWTQRANLIVITSADAAPVILTINAQDSWSAALLPSENYPRRFYRDSRSPPNQDAVYDITFVGFSAGNTYSVFVDGKSVKGRVKVPFIVPRTALQTLLVSYSSSSTATNVKRLRDAILLSSAIKVPEEVAVSYISGTTYRVTFSGSLGGVPFNVVASAESPSLRVEVATNADGRTGEEKAWSYPTVVTYSGGYYQCIAAHVSTASTPDTLPLLWRPLAAAPLWESLQPSAAWSSGSISYGTGGRGFPSACAFHDQRLILGGSPDAPQTFWGSAIGDPTNFALGVEDSDALSRDIDAQDAPAIRGLVSQQGLIIGTSAGIYRASADVTLTPANVNIEMYSADRVAARMPVVVGNEVLCISQDHTTLLAIRRNDRIGPYEAVDLTALAEHLGRYRMERLVYCRQPQPLLYIQTREPGLLLSVTYNRQYEMVAFAPFTINGAIDAIAPMFDENDGDVLWLAVRRGDTTSVERLAHPDTRVPGVASTTATVHLDGWIRASDTAGTVTGLRHLLGRSVTVLNSAGAVQGSSTVVLGGALVENPLTLTNPGFESGDPDGAGTNGWQITAVSVAGVATAYEGTRGVRLRVGAAYETAVASMRSVPITVVAGRQYRATCRFQLSDDMDFFGGEFAIPIRLAFYSDTGATTTIFSVPFIYDVKQLTWGLAEVAVQAPAGAVRARILVSLSSPSRSFDMLVDDYKMYETAPVDGVITATGTDLVIGEPFLGEVMTMEPAEGFGGPLIGKTKRHMEITARLYQSALPKINGDRPSDYEQGDYRGTPGALRTGEYEVNTTGWEDGAITIEMDLPHRTEVVALYGDLKVN